METERALRIEGPQIPQARPRVTQKRTYNPPNVWRDEIAARAKEVFRGWPQDRRYGVRVSMYGCSKRGDLDNYLKAVLDALQGTVYKNDNQVDDTSIQRLAYSRKRTYIHVRIL